MTPLDRPDVKRRREERRCKVCNVKINNKSGLCYTHRMRGAKNARSK